MELQAKAAEVLSRVTDAGATGDLIIDRGQAISLKAQQGNLEEHKVTSSQIFGLRVIKDNQVGTAYSEAADLESLASLVDQALVNASFAAEEAHEKVLANDQNLSTNDSALCPTDNISIDEKIDMALKLEADLSGRPKIKNVPYNGVQDSTSERHIFSTAGLTASTKRRFCSAYVYGLIEDGDKNAMEGVVQVARLFPELEPDALVEKAYRNTLDILDGTAVKSDHYDVIFDEEMQVSLFNVFTLMFSGKSAKDGINPLRDKVGQLVADERLTLLDRPDNVFGFGYDLFDDEGTPTQSLSLIESGVLNTLVHNSMTASYFGTQSTGHGTRGPRSTLGVGLHQLEIAPGDADEQTLHVGRYLTITDLTGLHSGANAISGDFSFGASGYLCEDGKRIQPVRGITVAGNFYQMLKNINVIGRDQHWNSERSALMPAVRFAEVAISG